ncbi:MAG: hypothetical protein WC346_10110 [Methanogenium sp.]
MTDLNEDPTNMTLEQIRAEIKRRSWKGQDRYALYPIGPKYAIYDYGKYTLVKVDGKDFIGEASEANELRRELERKWKAELAAM